MEEKFQGNISDIPMVILAAGYGSRIRSNGMNGPKPLTPIIGVSLLEHTLRTGAKAGVRKFFVVVGYEKEVVSHHALDLASRFGLDVNIVESRDWQLGNGASAAAPAGIIRGHFFITMCDHLFDSNILRKLIAVEDGSCICRIAVDKLMSNVFDLKEATLVSINGDVVVDIGKGILNPDAVDTGFFLCRDEFFEVLKNACASGKTTLSEAIKMAITSHGVKIADVSGLFWHDVDTISDLEHAELMLKQRVYSGS